MAPRLDDLEPRRKRFRRDDPQCVESRRESGAFNQWNNSWRTAKVYCLLDTTDEPAADDAFVDELVAHFELAPGRQVGEPRGSAGAARRAVDCTVAVKHGVTSVGTLALRFIGPHHVADSPYRRIQRMHRLHCLAHQCTDYRTEREDICSTERVDALVRALRLDDCVEISSVGDVYREWPEPRNIDPDACGCHVRRNVSDRDTGDSVPAGCVLDPDDPGGHFDAESASDTGPNEPMLECKRNHANRPMATHGQAAAGFEIGRAHV